MDDLYPGMNNHYDSNISTVIQLYLYTSVILCIILTFRFIFVKEQARIYRSRRKNTEDTIIV
jgi:hypothetical protein